MKHLNSNTRLLMCTIGLFLAWILSAQAFAEEVYKSVDAAGDVSFSDTPPANSSAVEQIDVSSGPAPGKTQQSQQRLQNMEKMANEQQDAIQSQAHQPATDSVPASGETAQGETYDYVGGTDTAERARELYREEKYSQDHYRDPDRYRDERAYQAPAEREIHEGVEERGVRESPGAVSHPAARVR